jgi:hypothetical protein
MIAELSGKHEKNIVFVEILTKSPTDSKTNQKTDIDTWVDISNAVSPEERS